MWKATLSAPAPALPEGCIAHVLAFTTLRNACRMPAVLSVFLLASESGVVWERFLPSDYPNILGRSLESSSQLDFSSSLDLRGQKAFMGIIKGCSKDLEDDDKVDEIFEDFDINVSVSPIFPPGVEENKNLEIFVIC
ncbi:F-box protein PP2-B3 isoform X3 [Vitis vinifera]|uniref:F-box protein PP2-B3 isoform X3 n=1 Tax=Vitis vinifera TaxID=29760 RepID=UPI00288319AD|nr:F-box protein PP2-B3 isoform X3 [Vitis vinifera]